MYKHFTHNKPTGYKKRFQRKFSLIFHKYQSTMDQAELMGHLRYSCCLCERTFMYKVVMNMHEDAMHSTHTEVKIINKHNSVDKKKIFDKLPCPYKNCHVICRYSKSLAKHVRAAHEPIETNREAPNTIPLFKICPHCGKSLGLNSLRAHIRHVHTGEIHLCSKCPFNTKNTSTLQIHFKRRHTAWKQSCEFCGKMVKALKTHLRATMCGKDVDDRKVIPCSKCHIVLRSNPQLRQHTKRVHEGVKDKHCPQCAYATYSSHNLRLHVSNVHDKKTMFRDCPHCHIKTGNLKKISKSISY